MNKNVILVRTRSFASIDYLENSLKTIKKNQFQIFENKKSHFDLQMSVKKSVIGIVAGVEQYDAHEILTFPNLLVISRVGVGLDSVDLGCARSQNIAIRVTESSAPTEAVAEFTLLCILDGLRNLSTNSEKTKRKSWSPVIGRELSEICVGLVGLGRIGSRVAEILTYFGSRVIVCDPIANNSKYEFVTMSTLFKQSDVVSIHIPMNDNNRNVVNLELLRTLKHNAIFINTSRGSIVNERDIEQILLEKEIKAYLDVFETEPYVGPLLDSLNVIPTSHIAGRTKSNRIKMEREAIDNLVEELRKRGF
jgi:D-3-phosphoglycerate dehydrogenase